MKKKTVGSLAVTAALASVFALSACNNVTFDREAPAFGANADVTLSVKAKTSSFEAEAKISDTLFGVFLEDINYAGYYLDNDLILNGNFDAVTKGANYGWSALNGNTATTIVSTGGILSGVEEYNARKVNPNHLKITVGSVAGGVKNSGYGGASPMAVTEGTEYKFSAFIKSPNKEFNMGVRVTDGTDDYLSGEFTVQQADEWVKYTRTFKASGSQKNNLFFEIDIPENTEVFIDGVSLETMDSTLGIKNTPYNAIKDLSPKFIRFPRRLHYRGGL